MVRAGVSALVMLGIGLASAPAAADPWVYLGNYADADGTNPLLIDQGSIAAEGAVTKAVVRMNVAVPDAEYPELAIAQYAVEMDCKARLFRFGRYDYLRADTSDTGVGERFLGLLNASTPLQADRPMDQRIFAYACNIDRGNATRVGKYGYAALKAKYGGTAAPPREDDDEDDWDDDDYGDDY